MLYSLDSNGKIANRKKTDKIVGQTNLDHRKHFYSHTILGGGLVESDETKTSKNLIDSFGLSHLIGSV